jgi:hypothetical protein
VPKGKTVLFFKAHVNDYTKKDGTVVKAHEDNRPGARWAKDAAEKAGESKDSVYGEHSRQLSEAAVGVTMKAKSPRDHMKAGQLHRELSQTHLNAARFIKQRGGNSKDIAIHHRAKHLHALAASEHEEKASKPR